MTCRELGLKLKKIIEDEKLDRSKILLCVDNIAEISDGGFTPHVYPLNEFKYKNHKVIASYRRWKLNDSMTLNGFASSIQRLANKYRFYYGQTDFEFPGFDIVGVRYDRLAKIIFIEINV